MVNCVMFYNKVREMTIKKVMYYFISITTLLSLVLSGCTANTVVTYTPLNNTNSEEYHTFSATGIPLFSFEYPVDYVITSYQPMPDFPGTSIIVQSSKYLNPSIYATETIATISPTVEETPSELKKFSLVEIDINYIGKYFKPADIVVDEFTEELKNREKEGRISDFKIIYKKKVIVDDIQGWEVKYSYTNYPDSLIVRTPTPLVRRAVFFDYNDMLFQIMCVSNVSITDETGKAYEHVLRTFKLIE